MAAPEFTPDGVTRNRPQPTPVHTITVPGSVKTMRIPISSLSETPTVVRFSDHEQVFSIYSR